MNGGTNKTLSRENIVPLTSFRIYLNDPLDLFASNVLFDIEGMCIANSFSPVMLWLFPQVFLQGVIIAIDIVNSCDTETLAFCGRWGSVGLAAVGWSVLQDAGYQQLTTTYLSLSLSLLPMVICYSCSSCLISSPKSKMLIMNNFPQPIWYVYDGEYLWKLEILTKFDVLNLV